MNPGILIVFHTPTNAGYAMSALERTFFRTCAEITQNEDLVHFSFTNTSDGSPKSLGVNFKNYIKLIYNDQGTYEPAKSYITSHNIKFALCFDLQANSPLCSFLRDAGIRKIVSYWGASISGKNYGLKLLAKKIEIFLRRNKPDHFIFESEAMRELAVQGRGIRKQDTSVIHTGINPEIFHPRAEAERYVADCFQLPLNSDVAIYSGHMEERKGVHIIIEAAIEIFLKDPNRQLYFIICGNRPGEENIFLEKLKGTAAEPKVIFAGYRNDLAEIMPGCTLGIVASTGWDSFPMSTLEMAGSGLPIIVSRLQGLVETVEDGVTGYTFTPGNAQELSHLIIELLTDRNKLEIFSKNATARILNGFTTQIQIENLKKALNNCFNY